MNYRNWLSLSRQVLLLLVIGLALALLIPFSQTVQASLGQLVQPPLPAVWIVAGLEEPLVPTQPTTTAENKALRRAIKTYQAIISAKGDFADSAQPLLEYVEQHPNSVWNMAIETNLGLGYYRAGYYSHALTAWALARANAHVS